MAEAGLFVGWGVVVRGRERKALAVFGDDQGFGARMQQEGRIESFETVILEPHGGDLAGFIVVRGTREELDRTSGAGSPEGARRAAPRRRPSTLGDGLEQLMDEYQRVLDETT